MALVTTGHVALPEKAYIELQNANANIDLVSTQSRIECALLPKILISLMCVSDILGSEDHTPTHTHGSQALVSSYVSAGSDFHYLDTKLQNLPKDLYVQKLLELTSSNEHIIIDYRSSLCFRAKTMEGCPSGNFTTRKSTKLISSVAKYAKDCFALHMFCSGDSSYLSDVFDKSKHGTSEFPKTSLIELRSVVQSLLQRLSQLEETHITDTKNMQNLGKTVSSLKSKNASLTSELGKLRNNIDTHASGCETFRKTTYSQLKCPDGLDKLNADVSRLSKLCSGLQNKCLK